MSKFTMYRPYEDGRTLKTDDLLTAVKETCNYEGDLYVDGYLVMSCLGLDNEDNTERLLKYGITSYVKDGTWRYKYTDESKNIKRYYVDTHPHKWEGVNKVQFNIHDYPQNESDEQFSSLRELFAMVRKYAKKGKYDPDDVHVVIWDEYWGCHSFSHGTWKVDEEPVRYNLFHLEKKLTHGTHKECETRVARLIELKVDWVKDPSEFEIKLHT